MTDRSKHRSPEDRARIEAMVAACIEALERGETDPATRLCGDDLDLRGHVHRRLAQLAARGLIPDSEMLPTAIGPYRVRSELGSGGMGHVYLADQLEPVRRQVALKVVKPGMDTREVIARFQAERQALAQMSHPHIAQVLDAGITSEGRPYFVMEYVQGQSLTTFCDRRRLDAERRVRLIATVCRAVQHAHDRGFIHRDLKPSNILVAEHEDTFVPKVIDFGVAKAIATAASDVAAASPSLRTRADQVLGTPEYMSPEQMASGGVDIDTRTDVYSLGVTLYELLCGELPFDSRRLRAAPRGELERILRDELPTQPSKRLSHVHADVVDARGGERARREVAGELDWITLKALAKQREQRYPSALALAEDLERWLRHEPVLAAPPGRTYRLRKFVRRHRVGVAAAASVLLALVVGLAVSLRATGLARAAAAEANAARSRESAALADTRAYFGLARDAVGNLVEIASTELVEVPQAEAVRRRMLADAMRFHEGLRARQPDDPELQLARLVASERVGALQLQLGRPIDAVATLRRCVDDAMALRDARPGTAATAWLVVTAGGELAAAAGAAGRPDDAQRALHDALAALQVARGVPAVAAADADAREARLLASLASQLDDTGAALSTFDRALAAYDRAGDDSAAAVLDRARTSIEHARALTRAGRVDDAADALTDAAGRVRALPADPTTRARQAEAKVQDALAKVLQRLDRLDEARAARQRAIDLYHQLAAEHPDVPAHVDDEAAGCHFLGELDAAAARIPQALQHVDRAVELRSHLAERYPQHHRLVMRCARSLLFAADLQIQAWRHHGGDPAAPQATLSRAVTMVDALRHEHPADFEVLQTWCAVHAAIALLHSTQHRHDAALREHTLVSDALDAARATFASNPDLHYQLAIADNNTFQALYLLERHRDALTTIGRARVHLERGLELDARHGPLRDLVPTLLGRLAAAQFATGDPKGGLTTLFELCERREWGDDAREQGALLLANHIGDADPGGALRTMEHLRAAIAARGPLAAARLRPPQRAGFSHTSTRLRDFDLRLALAAVAGTQQQHDEQQHWLAEAAELEATLPDISPDRQRNLFAQRAELALARGDAGAAETAVDELQRRIGDRPGASYMLAVLLARSVDVESTPAAQQRLAAKAVACLARAIATGEVPQAAASSASFAALRGRDDYTELLAR